MAPRQRPLYLSLGRLPRTSRNSFGPFRSRRLRRCRSSSGADGSIRRSISWAAISDACAAFLVRTPARGTLGACSVKGTDFHSFANDIRRIVVVLLLRLHHVENYRPHRLACIAPCGGKTLQ